MVDSGDLNHGTSQHSNDYVRFKNKHTYPSHPIAPTHPFPRASYTATTRSRQLRERGWSGGYLGCDCAAVMDLFGRRCGGCWGCCQRIRLIALEDVGAGVLG